jgi:hypothetical protein
MDGIISFYGIYSGIAMAAPRRRRKKTALMVKVFSSSSPSPKIP